MSIKTNTKGMPIVVPVTFVELEGDRKEIGKISVDLKFIKFDISLRKRIKK